MPLIQCITGPAETVVGNMTYAFDRDDKGRYVAEVHSLQHAAVLLSVVHYREVKDDDAEPEPAPKPAKKTGKKGTAAEGEPAEEETAEE